MHNDTKKTKYGQALLLSVLLGFLGASHIEAASLQKSVKEGNLLYEQGDYIASENKYSCGTRLYPLPC